MANPSCGSDRFFARLDTGGRATWYGSRHVGGRRVKHPARREAQGGYERETGDPAAKDEQIDAVAIAAHLSSLCSSLHDSLCLI
jgi:hypothetical protein